MLVCEGRGARPARPQEGAASAPAARVSVSINDDGLSPARSASLLAAGPRPIIARRSRSAAPRT